MGLSAFGKKLNSSPFQSALTSLKLYDLFLKLVDGTYNQVFFWDTISCKLWLVWGWLAEGICISEGRNGSVSAKNLYLEDMEARRAPVMKTCLRCFNIQAVAVERLYAFVETVLHQQNNDGNIGARTGHEHVVHVLFTTTVLAHLFVSLLPTCSVSSRVVTFWLMLLQVTVWLRRPGELDTRKNGHIFWTELLEALPLHLYVARRQLWTAWAVQQSRHPTHPRILQWHDCLQTKRHWVVYSWGSARGLGPESPPWFLQIHTLRVVLAFGVPHIPFLSTAPKHPQQH